MKKKPLVKASKKIIGMKVKYKNKEWELSELLEFMAERIKDLERHQCKPKAACLFEGQKYLETKFLPPGDTQTEFFYYG